MNQLNFKFPKVELSPALTLEVIPELISDINCKKPLIITDSGIRKAGLSDKLTEILDKAGVSYNIFDEIKENPTIKNVRNALECCDNYNNDILIGLGGGSSMDVAKSTAMLATNRNLFSDFNYHNRPLPVIACPTTAGTGAEVSDSAVLSDEKGKKVSLIHENISADFAVLDPQLVSTLPKKLAVSIGVDALDHHLAHYLSTSVTPISGAINEAGIGIILRNLVAFANDRTNLKAAQNMQLAATMGGMAFAHPRLGICHALAHGLSELFNIPHSIGIYLFLPLSLKYNRSYITSKLNKLGKLLQIEDGSVLDNSIEYFMCAIKRIYNISDDLPGTLKDLGLSTNDIPAITKIALTRGHCKVNPRPA